MSRGVASVAGHHQAGGDARAGAGELLSWETVRRWFGSRALNDQAVEPK